MATRNNLSKVESLISDSYREKEGRLKEPQAKMLLDITDYGRPYLLYQFDKIIKPTKGGKAIDLQPYFKANEGVKSMCDYFLFCWEKGKLFVLLIELKRGTEKVTTQLAAGKNFAQYLVNTLNRVENTSYTAEVRMIAIRDIHIARKGTSMKPVVYNKDSFCTFEGYSFQLPEFLK